MNAAHERARTMRDRAESWREAGMIDELTERAIDAQFPTPWRSYGILAQAAFFLLTSLGIGAAYFLLNDQLHVDNAGAILALAAIVVAEFLIGRLRWFGTGVEAALWLGGLFALVSRRGADGPQESLLFAAASALAGWRVRNPLFGALAAILVVQYCESRYDLGVITALAFAGIGAAALCRTWRRPSTEWLWIALALALPFAGWSAADPIWRTTTIVLYAIYGIATLAAALAKRHHALFFASLIGFAIAGVELGKELALVLEAKLAIAGALLLASSFVVARALRDRTNGFVTTKESLTGLDSSIEIAGTLLAAPQAAPESDSRGGGRFGGAGATGDY